MATLFWGDQQKPRSFAPAKLRATLLTSPNGRHGNCGYNAIDYARCDVSLPFDPNDTGTFTEQSTSSVFCTAMGGWFVWNVLTSASIEIHFGYSLNVYHFSHADATYCYYDLTLPCPVFCNPPWATAPISSPPVGCTPYAVGFADFVYVGPYPKTDGTNVYCLHIVAGSKRADNPGACSDHPPGQ